MKTWWTCNALVALALVAAGPALPQANLAKNLQITFVDTEGGAATLIVTPSGESLLIDTGYPVADRDAKRIFAAAQQAGLRKIDHLLISHFHDDHTGGLAALSRMIPIEHFYDHGDTLDDPDPQRLQADRKRLEGYRALVGSKRIIVKAGDMIPLQGVSALIVTSDGKMLDQTVNGGGPNPLCADAPRMSQAAGENAHMVGVLLGYNNFTYLNLIDLDWYQEMQLVCPINKVGMVSVFQMSRHGSSDGANSPALLGAIQPQVVVVPNGPHKGFGQTDTRIQPLPVAGKPSTPYERNGYLRLAKNPGIEGIWQGHLSLLDTDPSHNTARDMIANFEDTPDCEGHAITASVAADGKFTMTNTRNGFSKSYAVRSRK
jgi:competence protein ComEC